MKLTKLRRPFWLAPILGVLVLALTLYFLLGSPSGFDQPKFLGGAQGPEGWLAPWSQAALALVSTTATISALVAAIIGLVGSARLGQRGQDDVYTWLENATWGLEIFAWAFVGCTWAFTVLAGQNYGAVIVCTAILVLVSVLQALMELLPGVQVVLRRRIIARDADVRRARRQLAEYREAGFHAGLMPGELPSAMPVEPGVRPHPLIREALRRRRAHVVWLVCLFLPVVLLVVLLERSARSPAPGSGGEFTGALVGVAFVVVSVTLCLRRAERTALLRSTAARWIGVCVSAIAVIGAAVAAASLFDSTSQMQPVLVYGLAATAVLVYVLFATSGYQRAYVRARYLEKLREVSRLDVDLADMRAELAEAEPRPELPRGQRAAVRIAAARRRARS